MNVLEIPITDLNTQTKQNLTSPIFETFEREPPKVPVTNGKTNTREEELNLSRPLFSWLRLCCWMADKIWKNIFINDSKAKKFSINSKEGNNSLKKVK